MCRDVVQYTDIIYICDVHAQNQITYASYANMISTHDAYSRLHACKHVPVYINILYGAVGSASDYLNFVPAHSCPKG
jgi:hypothetical protein